MNLEIKTGFNELKMTPELGSMASSTRCCATGTCPNMGLSVDLTLGAVSTSKKAEATMRALST